MQDMVSFSFLIYSLATLFFVIGGNLFNVIDTILVIGLGMPLYHGMEGVLFVREGSTYME